MSEPFNEEAERALIGCALLDAGTLDKTAIRADQFGNLVWRSCWEVMQEIHSRGVPLDPLVVQSEWERRGATTSIILQLSQALSHVPTAENSDHYAELIRDSWLRREIGFLADELKQPGKTGADLAALLDSRVGSLTVSSGGRLPTLDKVIADEIRQLQKPTPVGLPSGIGIEAVVPGGIPIDRVTTIFGESGSFKSTVKNAIVHAMASAGHVVVDCSFEDSNSLTAARWIARDTGLAYGDLAARAVGMVADPRLPSLAAAGRVIAAGDMAPTMDEVVRVARQYKRLANARAVVVDYIQLLEGSNQKEALDDAMRRAQILAKRENLAVIFVSQVKQDVGTVYDRKEKRLTMYDTLGSSSIRTATKLGLSVFRPFNHCKAPLDTDGPYGVYARMREVWPDGPEAFDGIYPELLEVIVAKSVAGRSPATVYCRVKPETGVITPFYPERYL